MADPIQTTDPLNGLLYIRNDNEYWSWKFEDAIGSSATITYGYPTSLPTREGSVSGFKCFTDVQANAVTAIIGQIESCINIDFVFEDDVGSGNDIDLTFVNHDLPDRVWGHATDGYVSVAPAYMYADYSPGTYNYLALCHEIGHALGLKHAQNYSEGESNPYELAGVYSSYEYTVMSYPNEPVNSGYYGNGYPIGFQKYDLIALQYLWGKVEYGSDKADVLYGSDYKLGNGGYYGTDDGSADSYGRRGDDRLEGGGGNDVIYGGAGEDELHGDADNDLLYGEEGNDLLDGGTGNDLLNGGIGDDAYYFRLGDGVDTVNDTWGANTFEFDSGVNRDMLDIKSSNGVYSLVYGDQGDSIVLGSDLNIHANDIIEFSDGSTMTIGDVVMDDVRAMLQQLIARMQEIFQHV
jgi:hypothetical protein